MTKNNFIPVLASLTQVFSPELLAELDNKSLPDFSKSDWGSDRVVSLRDKDTTVKSQWNGTCTSFAVTAALENKLGSKTELSERSLWDAYGVFSTSQAINAALNHYLLEEKYWPQSQGVLDPQYKGKGRYRVTEAPYLETDFSSLMKAIDNGNPCVVAMAVPKKLGNGDPQIEENTGIQRKGGHACCVSGYKIENGKPYFLIKNSWGEDNGDKGYQYLAYNLFNKRSREYAVFWEIKSIQDRGEQPFTIFMEELDLISDYNPALSINVIVK